MKKIIHIILLIIALMTTSKATADDVGNAKCPIIKLEAERLPDMTVPRSGHSAFLANGEVTVVGGHTSGFVLTPTAEYFEDGKWHQLQTVYTHDGGISIVMKSGLVLLAGGFKDNLGIGQSFEVELYDPATHQSKGFGCLDQKRVAGAAVELDSGRVMITGNWYTNDGIEIFDGKTTLSHVRDVTQSHYLPHLFRTSDGDVLIVAGYDNHGESIDTIVVDRLYGEPFRNELFDNWHPLHYDLAQHSDDSFIGDETKGEFRYLMPVENKDGQLAIIDVRDTIFTPLPTSAPIPMNSQWGDIKYITPVYADRQHQRGYIVGFDKTSHLYALCIDYARNPATLKLYHTDPLPEAGMLTIPVLTAEGNLMLTGGIGTEPNGNFSPKASVWLLRFNDEGSEATASTNGWLWGLLAAGLLLAFVVFFVLKRRKPQPQQESEEPSEAVTKGDEQLMQRICHLMDEKQLYLQQGLKVSDIASALGINSRYVSDCVKAVRGCSLTQFVNEYRVEHAKRLLLERPEMKISTVAIESGFTNDKAMTRYFKEQTGMTPTEWKNDNQA
ncbi:MAG: helix-turn-helix domain-containing protein [Prevotella sp.]|nr:helix-turn-helix domain-containing protein [Prevotella sp.]